MEAKHMKRISQAHHGMLMGAALQAIITAANMGESEVTVDIELNDSLEKYLTDLGYKIKKAEKNIVISW